MSLQGSIGFVLRACLLPLLRLGKLDRVKPGSGLLVQNLAEQFHQASPLQFDRGSPQVIHVAQNG